MLRSPVSILRFVASVRVRQELAQTTDDDEQAGGPSRRKQEEMLTSFPLAHKPDVNETQYVYCGKGPKERFKMRGFGGSTPPEFLVNGVWVSGSELERHTGQGSAGKWRVSIK